MVSVIDETLVFGDVQSDALRQIQTSKGKAFKSALMADHHLGYSVPIGGVLAYENAVSPSGVGTMRHWRSSSRTLETSRSL